MAASPHVPFFDPESPVFRAHEGGKLGVHATQAAARPRRPRRCSTRPGVAEVSLAIAADPAPVDPLHRAGQHRGRHQRRHGRARARRHRPARGDAGHGGQGGALQALRRDRRRAGGHGDGHRRGAGRGDRPDRPLVRRHQPRGHLGAPLLRDRGAAQGAARHPGVPRRPARHRDRRARRPAQRRQGARPPAARPAGRRLRRRRGRRRRDPAAASGPGVRDVVVCDSRGIISPARQDLTGHKGRLAASTNPRGLTGALGGALAGADVFVGVSGGQVPEDEIAPMAPDAHGLRAREPHPRGAPRRGSPACRGRRHRALGLPEPDQQRARLPRHLPRGAGRRAPPRSPRR